MLEAQCISISVRFCIHQIFLNLDTQSHSENEYTCFILFEGRIARDVTSYVSVQIRGQCLPPAVPLKHKLHSCLRSGACEVIKRRQKEVMSPLKLGLLPDIYNHRAVTSPTLSVKWVQPTPEKKKMLTQDDAEENVSLEHNYSMCHLDEAEGQRSVDVGDISGEEGGPLPTHTL